MRIELLEIDEETEELKAVETIGIKRIRALTEFVALTSHRQRAKVAVIAPAERMQGPAANALLKTLEEPPAGTFIILVADLVGRLPATIVSRCRRVKLPLPDPDAASAWLAEQGVAEPQLALAQAAGAPLAALELADPAWQVERRVWLVRAWRAATAAGDRARGARRRRREGRTPRTARARDRLAALVDRRPRARHRGGRRAPQSRLCAADGQAGPAGGADRGLSLS